MPTAENAQVIVDGLKASGINLVASLPDAALMNIVEAIDQENEIIHIPLTREEEGIGICTGGYLAGRRCAVLMQNAGLLNTCNGLTTTTLQFEIPMLLLVLYAGTHGDVAFAQLGQVTEPVLTALGLKYYHLDDLDKASSVIHGAMIQAYNYKKPVAILIHKSVV